MAQMIHHADAIARDVPTAPVFVEYPKMMAHPGYAPADVGTEVKGPGGFTHHVGGTPARFPPMLVHGSDDEEYYAAKGYVSQGKSDAAAFQRLATAARPKNTGYQPVEYPKWAGGVLVNNGEEEAAALTARREQLAIKTAPVEQPETKVYIPPPDEAAASVVAVQEAAAKAQAHDQRLAAIEQQMAEIRQMMAQLLVAQSKPDLTPFMGTVEPIEIPLAPPYTVTDLSHGTEPAVVSAEKPLSKQQKAANTRKRTALAKAEADAA